MPVIATKKFRASKGLQIRIEDFKKEEGHD
jgi:hypothetical protein